MLIKLEEFDQDIVGCRNHDIFPESQVGNPFFKNNASRPQLINHVFDRVGLDSEVVNASPSGVLGGLVIEVKSATADLHEYVSCADEFRIEDDVAPEKFFIELDAFVNIRSKNMNMMDVANQFGLRLNRKNGLMRNGLSNK